MNRVKRLAEFAAVMSMVGGHSSAIAGDGSQPSVAGSWQHRKVTMDYYGLTTLYTCDGLETHVRELLGYWGARQDMKVRARGCNRGLDSPSRSASVEADFYSLEPASNTSALGAIPAHWTSVEVNPRRPNFMADGDCELVQYMKDLTLKNFSLRNVEYRTSCVPHEVTLAGFSVKAEALQPVKAPGDAKS